MLVKLISIRRVGWEHGMEGKCGVHIIAEELNVRTVEVPQFVCIDEEDQNVRSAHQGEQKVVTQL